MTNEIVLINVTGRDRTGLIARITDLLAQHDANVLDIGEAVIHDYISFGMLIEIPSVLPDSRFRAAVVEPPTVVSEAERNTPAMKFGTATVPSALVPIRLWLGPK